MSDNGIGRQADFSPFMKNARPVPSRIQKQRGSASAATTLPYLEIPSWEMAFRSHLQNLSPQELAGVAAGLSRGGPLTEAKAKMLIDDACMLLGTAASKLAFSQSPPVQMHQPRPTKAPEVSGALFLRKHLPGSGPVYVERRREFGRRVMQFFECSGALGISRRFQTPAEIDGWLAYFKSIKLPPECLEPFETIVAQIKGAPEVIRKRAEARRRGGLSTAARSLMKYLRANGRTVHVADLMENSRFTAGTLERLISEFPETFLNTEHRGLPAIRLRNSGKSLKHP